MCCAGDKSRATWTAALEKSLVDLLLEHNTTYYRSQNGWSSKTWNLMVSTFNKRHPHLKFAKTHVQNKEKDLKRDYKVLKEARKQSGVGWDDAKCMLLAEPHLWSNLIISLEARLKPFKRGKAFPLYDMLGELYDGKCATVLRTAVDVHASVCLPSYLLQVN